MIDFFKYADRKRAGELDFVPDRIEICAMNIICKKRNKNQASDIPKPEKVQISPARAFFDCYYETV